MRIIIIPALSYFLQVDACPPYPYSKTWADAKEDIVWIIHTSGTTGTFPSFLFLESEVKSDLHLQAAQSHFITQIDSSAPMILGR